MTEENDLLVDIVESEHHTRALPVINYDDIDYGGIKISKTDKYINNEPVYTIDAIYNEEYVIASTTINKETGAIRSVFPVYTNELELGFSGKSVASIICGKILSHAINNGAVKDGMKPLPLILCVALSVANIKDKFRIYYQAGYDTDAQKNTLETMYCNINENAHIINIFGSLSSEGGHIDILTKYGEKDLLFDTNLTTLNRKYIPFNLSTVLMYNVAIYNENGSDFKEGCDVSNILVEEKLQGPMSCFLMCLSYIECIKTGKIPEDKIEEYFKDGKGQLLVVEQAFNFVDKNQQVLKITKNGDSFISIKSDFINRDGEIKENYLSDGLISKDMITQIVDIEEMRQIYNYVNVPRHLGMPMYLQYSQDNIISNNHITPAYNRYNQNDVGESTDVVVSSKEEQVSYDEQLKPKKQGGCVLL